MTDRSEDSGLLWHLPDSDLQPTVPDPDLQSTVLDPDLQPTVSDPDLQETVRAHPPAQRGNADDDAYSATALDAHWSSSQSGPAEVQPESMPPPTGAAPTAHESGVFRFGPGVPPLGVGDTAAEVWHGTLPGNDHSERHGRLHWLRRYRLAAAVLTVVVIYLLWPQDTPDMRITEVAAHTNATLTCDKTAEVIAVASTNGQPGTITYQWNRSDGTSSGPLEKRLSKGQHETRLRLLWTFHGKGTDDATAQLLITSPTPHTVSVSFTYTCR
ncbi:hypothetical protein [Streptomyces sp. 8N706]|uniref:hypothetical protein n=1 Tax=Streptomyces sp. 8N706 TaxID=3457416 RepID=UPI003FD6601D